MTEQVIQQTFLTQPAQTARTGTKNKAPQRATPRKTLGFITAWWHKDRTPFKATTTK
jgi:hypothetical protein